jgi:hypothetical protein
MMRIILLKRIIVQAPRVFRIIQIRGKIKSFKKGCIANNDDRVIKCIWFSLITFLKLIFK